MNGRSFKIKQFDAKYFKERYPHLWATFETELPILSEHERAIALSVTVGVCRYCWEASTPCACMRDE
jgi:hypothetical protein